MILLDNFIRNIYTTFMFIIPVIFFIIMVLIIYYSFKTGVVPVPSSFKDRVLVLEIVSKYKNHSNITELGAGWGGLINMISKRYPKNKYTAIELSIIPYLTQSFITYFKGQYNINWKLENFMNSPLENDTIYITYLSGPVMKKLRSRFEQDLPKNVILISIAFAMPSWTHTAIEYTNSKIYTPIYIYELA